MAVGRPKHGSPGLELGFGESYGSTKGENPSPKNRKEIIDALGGQSGNGTGLGANLSGEFGNPGSRSTTTTLGKSFAKKKTCGFEGSLAMDAALACRRS